MLLPAPNPNYCQYSRPWCPRGSIGSMLLIVCIGCKYNCNTANWPLQVFVCMSVCESLSVCLSVCLYVCLCVCVCVCWQGPMWMLLTTLITCRYTCLSLSVCLCVCLSVCLYVCLYVCVCVCVCVLTGADVNAADNSRNSPLHVILAAHQQTTQRSTSNDVVQNSAKALDKALSLHEVIYC